MENLYTVDTYDYTRIQNITCLHDTRSNRGTKKKKDIKIVCVRLILKLPE